MVTRLEECISTGRLSGEGRAAALCGNMAGRVPNQGTFFLPEEVYCKPSLRYSCANAWVSLAATFLLHAAAISYEIWKVANTQECLATGREGYAPLRKQGDGFSST